MNNVAKKRLQFDFTEEAAKELNELQKTTGLPTKAEVIRHALRFLQWAMEETTQKGATLMIERNGEIRELIFPFGMIIIGPTMK